jgi:hypothetical protein
MFVPAEVTGPYGVPLVADVEFPAEDWLPRFELPVVPEIEVAVLANMVLVVLVV